MCLFNTLPSEERLKELHEKLSNINSKDFRIIERPDPQKLIIEVAGIPNRKEADALWAQIKEILNKTDHNYIWVIDRQ